MLVRRGLPRGDFEDSTELARRERLEGVEEFVLLVAHAEVGPIHQDLDDDFDVDGERDRVPNDLLVARRRLEIVVSRTEQDADQQHRAQPQLVPQRERRNRDDRCRMHQNVGIKPDGYQGPRPFSTARRAG